MACENGHASGCTPASASEQSLKVDIYRVAPSQLFHPLTTWGSMHAGWRDPGSRHVFFWWQIWFSIIGANWHLIWTTIASEPATFRTSTPAAHTSTEIRSRNVYIRVQRFVYLGRKYLHRLPSLQAIFQPANSVWEIQINSTDVNSCGNRLGK